MFEGNVEYMHNGIYSDTKKEWDYKVCRKNVWNGVGPFHTVKSNGTLNEISQIQKDKDDGFSLVCGPLVLYMCIKHEVERGLWERWRSEGKEEEQESGLWCMCPNSKMGECRKKGDQQQGEKGDREGSGGANKSKV